jgi:hypothetical protein
MIRCPIKNLWRAMHNRCYNINHKSFAHYGGRGIFVDPRWHRKAGFEAFVADMGERPEGSSIERVDNDGPYSPENCRWATQMEQAKNKRNNRWLTANGVTKHMTEWSRDLGCTPTAIWRRLRDGMSEQDAATLPIPKRPNSKLTEADALYVVETYPSMTAQAIATKLGVSKKSVLNILHGKTFADVTKIGARHGKV